jgi:phage-related tail fiber protein
MSTTDPQYFSEWTAKGRALLRNFLTGGPALSISVMTIGDGNGTAVNPRDANNLVHEVFRGAAVVLAVPDRPDLIQVLMAVPLAVGGWTAREIAVEDAQGNVVAIGNMPDTPKVVQASGAPNEFVIKMYLAITNAASVVITIDNSVIFASQAFVTSSVTVHTQQADPHPGYLLRSAAAAGYAPMVHTHVIADTAGLRAELDARVGIQVFNDNTVSLPQLIYFGNF